MATGGSFPRVNVVRCVKLNTHLKLLMWSNISALPYVFKE
jgi:hypothetical protein